MSNLKQLSATLTASLRLAQPPVAVCLTKELPAGVPLWSGSAPAGCRLWQEGATRTFATAARQHDLCAIGIYTHNLASTPATDADLSEALRVFGDLGYVRPEDIGQIPVLAQRAGICGVRAARRESGAAGRGAAVRAGEPGADPVRSGATIGGRVPAGDGPSGVRRGSTDRQQRERGGEPGVLRRPGLSRRDDRRCGAVRHPGSEAGSLHGAT